MTPPKRSLSTASPPAPLDPWARGAGLASLALAAVVAGACDARPYEPLIAMPECQPPTAESAPRCPGAPRPQFALEDIQPASAGFGESYGLEAFAGTVTVVSLYAGW